MQDPQTREFQGRLQRIDKIHRSGGGFEASGTLGQSYYTQERHRSRSKSLLRPALKVVAAVVLLKGLLLASMGTEAYVEKVVVLQDGSIGDQIAGFVMSIDPLTRTVADLVSPFFG